MSLSKPRLVASVLAVAGLGAVALGYAAPHVGRAWLPQADRVASAPATQSRTTAVADTPAPQDAPAAPVETGRDVRVEAPHTGVRVDKNSGRVAVRAPYTDVKVDPDKGQVRVRAPYVDLNIRW